MIGVGIAAGACLACMALLICMFWTSVLALAVACVLIVAGMIKSTIIRVSKAHR
jgi:hypothetical protein